MSRSVKFHTCREYVFTSVPLYSHMAHMFGIGLMGQARDLAARI